MSEESLAYAHCTHILDDLNHCTTASFRLKRPPSVSFSSLLLQCQNPSSLLHSLAQHLHFFLLDRLSVTALSKEMTLQTSDEAWLFPLPILLTQRYVTCKDIICRECSSTMVLHPRLHIFSTNLSNSSKESILFKSNFTDLI